MDINICHLSDVLTVGITKMLFSRRDMEPAQRTNAFKIADSLSEVLQSHISWKRLGKGLIRFLSPVPEMQLHVYFILTKTFSIY